jgi:hypothetical protein
VDRRKKPDAITEPQIVFEYVSAVPYKDAERKIEDKHRAKLRFDSFEESDESRIYSIVISANFIMQSYGYQLRLKPWNNGDHTHVALHKVDYHHFQIDYNWNRVLLYVITLSVLAVSAYIWNWQGTVPLAIIAVFCVLLIVLLLTSRKGIGRLFHGSGTEQLIIETIQSELGEAPDDNIIDEQDAQISINRGRYENQA